MSLQTTNSEFDENGRKFSKRLENTVEKGEIARLRAISRFPTVFSKDLYCRQVKTWERVKGIAKSLKQGKPAQSMQVEMGRNILLSVNFLHVKEPFDVTIQSVV